MSQVTIRLATIDDAEALYNIYEPYILNTVITFEYNKVPIQEFSGRIKNIMSRFPWLVCIMDGEIAGYAYCSPYLVKAAFGWDCECTIYLSDKFHGRKIGTALYDALFQLVKAQGYYNIYSLICVPNDSSVSLHKKFGFTDVGTYFNTAYKLGEWRHLLVMEKKLRETKGEPEPIIPYFNLDTNYIDEVLKRAEKIIVDK